MLDLFRAELLKLRTTRTFVAIISIAVASSLLIVVLVSLLTEPTEDAVLRDVFGAAESTSFFILILAVVGISGEWRHRTITSSLLVAPHRIRFLLAKTISYAAAGVVVSLVISIAVGIVGATILGLRDLPVPSLGELVVQALRNAGLAALLGALGIGIGGLIRNQVVAVVGLLVLAFVVEPLLMAVAPDVGRFGPTSALPVAIAGVSDDSSGDDVQLPGAALAVAAMLAWIAVAFAAAALLLQQRDLE